MTTNDDSGLLACAEVRRHQQYVGELLVVRVNTGAPWRENCYFVMSEDSREAVLVDPGDQAGAILSLVEHFHPNAIDVVLTHGHFDHVCAVGPVCEKLAVSCMVHEADVRLVRQAPLWALRLAGSVIKAPGPLIAFSSWEKCLGGNTVVAVPTPGHTPGGVSYRFPGFVMTGDTLMEGKVGRTDLPGADLETLRTSVDGLLASLTDETLLFPGHGRPWHVGEARAWWKVMRPAPPALKDFG